MAEVEGITRPKKKKAGEQGAGGEGERERDTLLELQSRYLNKLFPSEHICMLRRQCLLVLSRSLLVRHMYLSKSTPVFIQYKHMAGTVATVDTDFSICREIFINSEKKKDNKKQRYKNNPLKHHHFSRTRGNAISGHA